MQWHDARRTAVEQSDHISRTEDKIHDYAVAKKQYTYIDQFISVSAIIMCCESMLTSTVNTR